MQHFEQTLSKPHSKTHMKCVGIDSMLLTSRFEVISRNIANTMSSWNSSVLMGNSTACQHNTIVTFRSTSNSYSVDFVEDVQANVTLRTRTDVYSYVRVSRG